MLKIDKGAAMHNLTVHRIQRQSQVMSGDYPNKPRSIQMKGLSMETIATIVNFRTRRCRLWTLRSFSDMEISTILTLRSRLTSLETLKTSWVFLARRMRSSFEIN